MSNVPDFKKKDTIKVNAEINILPQDWKVTRQRTPLEIMRHSVDEYAKVASFEVAIGVLRDEIERLKKLTSQHASPTVRSDEPINDDLGVLSRWREIDER